MILNRHLPPRLGWYRHRVPALVSRGTVLNCARAAEGVGSLGGIGGRSIATERPLPAPLDGQALVHPLNVPGVEARHAVGRGQRLFIEEGG